MTVGLWQGMLRELTGLPGVRGALVFSSDDGLVVAETAMDQVSTADVAALGSALVTRAERAAAAFDTATPRAMQLTADGGVLVMVAGPAPLWLAALAEPDAELGRLRLLVSDFAGALQ